MAVGVSGQSGEIAHPAAGMELDGGTEHVRTQYRTMEDSRASDTRMKQSFAISSLVLVFIPFEQLQS